MNKLQGQLVELKGDCGDIEQQLKDMHEAFSDLNDELEQEKDTVDGLEKWLANKSREC